MSVLLPADVLTANAISSAITKMRAAAITTGSAVVPDILRFERN